MHEVHIGRIMRMMGVFTRFTLVKRTIYRPSGFTTEGRTIFPSFLFEPQKSIKHNLFNYITSIFSKKINYFI